MASKRGERHFPHSCCTPEHNGAQPSIFCVLQPHGEAEGGLEFQHRLPIVGGDPEPWGGGIQASQGLHPAPEVPIPCFKGSNPAVLTWTEFLLIVWHLGENIFGRATPGILWEELVCYKYTKITSVWIVLHWMGFGECDVPVIERHFINACGWFVGSHKGPNPNHAGVDGRFTIDCNGIRICPKGKD